MPPEALIASPLAGLVHSMTDTNDRADVVRINTSSDLLPTNNRPRWEEDIEEGSTDRTTSDERDRRKTKTIDTTAPAHEFRSEDDDKEVERR